MISTSYVGKNIERFALDSGNNEQRQSGYVQVSNLAYINNILRMLNEKDRDIFYLVFVAKKKQKAIQKIMGRSQPSLCYDIKKIRLRMKFIHFLNKVSGIYNDFAVNHDKNGFTNKEITILTAMFYTTSYTHASLISGIQQHELRTVFSECLAKLKEKENWEIYEIFNNIKRNLNIIRRFNYGEDIESNKMNAVCMSVV